VLQNSVNAPNIEVNSARVTEAIRDTALGTFFGLLLSALASALGGWLGDRTRNPIGHMADDG
jgi:nitrate/nitrite transporter NarK